MILFNFMHFLFPVHIKDILSKLLSTFQKASRLVTSDICCRTESRL